MHKKLAAVTILLGLFGVAWVVSGAEVKPTLEHWFFISAPEDHLKEKIHVVGGRTYTVKVNQDFGCYFAFQPGKPHRLVAELRVPNSPERFLTHLGKLTISPDHKTVTVELDIDATKGSAGFFWGIGPGDPQGRYAFLCKLDGATTEKFKLKVIK
ncbi:MAG: hypothetical protein HY074_15665 [Deltaproteobacteria bacterium]|nr:hypothetical protein [Deltaproteobacteria bacterium]